MTKRDIQERSDIDELMTAFYEVAMVDPLIGHHFDDLDLAAHLPVIGDFWEKALFGRPVYHSNPLIVHQQLHAKLPLEPEHFSRWVVIFVTTVDSLFAGEMAENAKLRARMIADSMNQRLNPELQATALSNFQRFS